MTRIFDLAGLLEACASWPTAAIQDQKAIDPVLERVRQVLRQSKARPGANIASDLIPLLRQALLSSAIYRDGTGRMRVPLVPGWPSAEQWRESGFDVLDNGDWLSVRPHLPRVGYLGAQADLFDEVFQRIQARIPMMVDADPVFSYLLGLPQYTGPGQREAVRALVQLPVGETLIANLPTGSGKSVLAQLSPLLMGPGRLTVAIVPTVALAIDQAERMRPLLQAQEPHASLPPLAYHGGLDEAQRKEVWESIRDGRQRILFLSPEHATTTLRASLENAAREGRISHVVMDEAHLVIGWGNGFRPAFQLLPALVRSLQRLTIGVPLRVVLCSATLTATTIAALRQLFSDGQRTHLVAGVHVRPEPRYAFSHADSESTRRQRIIEVLRLAPRPYILYVTRPEEAESWATQLRGLGFGRLATFTGRTGALEREKLLARWRDNELDGMVATSAFGLGVDKSDVRTIVHATLPESLDRFYQEVGRSGRDGLASASVLVYTDEDVDQARRMAKTKVARERTAFERWCLMIDQAQVDPERPDVFWLNLERLPARLVQQSDASAEWNIKTLILMARAGMLELVALTRANGPQDNAQDVQAESEARFAAVRLLLSDHRIEKSFSRALAQGRAQVRRSGTEGYRTLLSVVEGHTEIADALRQTYSIVDDGVWSPVARYCGGCPVHWGGKRWPGRPLAPVVPRLDHFEPRDAYKSWIARWPLASDNLLVIDVPSDARHATHCQAVMRAVLHRLLPHTLVLGPGVPPELEFQVLDHAGLAPASWPFVEDLRAPGSVGQFAGRDEIRITVWWPGTASPLPDVLWTSGAALEILVIPADLAHPTHLGRRLTDTTPHVHAEDIVNTLIS
jgi:superfamily II DNA/RNA helicase